MKMELYKNIVEWFDHFGPGTWDSLLTLGTVATFCALARVIYVPETVFRRRMQILFGNAIIGLVIGKIAIGLEIVTRYSHLIAALFGLIGDKVVGAIVKKGSQIEQNPNRAKDLWK
jgi:hypothetical protein